MNDRRLAFVYAPEIEGLSYPPDCPFKTQRAALTRSKFASFGLLGAPIATEVAARQATSARVAADSHRPLPRRTSTRRSGGSDGGGFAHGPGRTGHAGVQGHVRIRRLGLRRGLDGGGTACLAGKADIAFNLLGRLSSRHAGAGGRLLLSQRRRAGLQRLAAAGKRVVYLDVDAHHGDGVQEAFYQRSDVLTISLHESGKTLYPWGGFENEIGEGPGLGYNVKSPCRPARTTTAFLMAFERVVVPLLGAYRPDVIVLELGMDTLAGDPLTHLQHDQQHRGGRAGPAAALANARCWWPAAAATTSRTPCAAGRWPGAPARARTTRTRFQHGLGRRDAGQLGMGGRPARPAAARHGRATRQPWSRTARHASSA